MIAFFRILLLCVFVAGCSSTGFNRSKLRGHLESSMRASSPVVTQAQIINKSKLKPSLPQRFRLGLYFSESKNKSDWNWSNEDKETIRSIEKKLIDDRLISEVVIIKEATSGRSKLKDIRASAANQDVDAVLIVSGAGEIISYYNNRAWSYWLIIPSLFVAGTEVQTLFISNATLWNVESEYLYLTAEAEQEDQGSYSPVSLPIRHTFFEKAKSEALIKLRSRIIEMVREIKK